MTLDSFSSFFFVGIAGTGMSAIAQYLQGVGKQVSGSDRLFGAEQKIRIQTQFEEQGIACYFQDGSGITKFTDVVIVSTAIEQSNVEYQKALELGIPVMKRSELLAAISNSIKTIAVGGTSGKSTTTAMIFHILQTCGKSPSLITGAGLSELQERGMPGNAWVGTGEWLVIEADESDGSIVNYKPEISVLLNIDRDHKEYDELIDLFTIFKQNTASYFIANQDYELTKQLSDNHAYNFGTEHAPICGTNFKQEGFKISFVVQSYTCNVPVIGKHNMENALAAISVAHAIGVSVGDACLALQSFRGIYRRTQLVGKTDANIYVVDDFAHNPAEVAAAIKACQSIAPCVVAWFQPHGFGPLRFMHEELAEFVSRTLRETDAFLIADVYYAGGTVDKNISPTIVSDFIALQGKQAVYTGSKEQSLQVIAATTPPNAVVLIMGARDPYLDAFAQQVFDYIKSK